jgi:hypothetical protein
MSTFAEQLMTARRQSQASGRPLTSQETSGIAAAAADTASVRLARGKTLELQEEAQVTQESQFAEQLAIQKGQAEAQEAQFAQQQKLDENKFALETKAAKKAEARQKEQDTIQKAQTAKSVLGGSWLCSETEKISGLTIYEAVMLYIFRDYADKHYNHVFKSYTDNADNLLEAIAKKKSDIITFYNEFKKSSLNPLIELIKQNELYDACVLFTNILLDLIDKYSSDSDKKLMTLKHDLEKNKEECLKEREVV